MAKLIETHSLQQWREALKAMPPQLMQATNILVGEEITINRVLITFVLAGVLFLVARVCFRTRRKLPPAIPGVLPVLGNLLQLSGKKPHRIFTAWAQNHGPIFTVKFGTITQLVINNSDLAKEVMVTKYASVSRRELTMAVQVMTRDKMMVSMSDYGDDYRMLKKLLVNNLLGPNAQNKNRSLREQALVGMVDGVLAELNGYPKSTGVVNVRGYFQRSLFPFAMTQVWGYVPDQIEVPELGATVPLWEMFDAFVITPMRAVMSFDWRDFFPALKWIPNPIERYVRGVSSKGFAITNALIREQRKRLANLEGPPRSLADILLKEATHLTEIQLAVLLWATIFESSDTTLVTSEWAMYELAKNPKCQDRLYQEIVSVVGTERMVTEDDLPKMPYLKAVVKETLRQYPPIPLLPPRLVEEDITVGGYDIPKGWPILLNMYAIGKDPAVWSNPEIWDPERVLGDDNIDMGFKNFDMMPFGAGKRMCAGITQAMAIIPVNLAALVQHCEWRLSPAEIENMNMEVEDVAFLTTHKLSALTCVATARIPQRLP